MLIIINGYNSLSDVSYGCVTWTHLDENKIKAVLMYFGGPLISLVVSILIYICIINVSLPYIIMRTLNALLLFSEFQFLLTILPMKYFYKPYICFTSDGYKILQQLKIENRV